MSNYWDRLIDNDGVSRNDLFLKIRDNYTACLRHLFDDTRDIPEYRIYFSLKEVTPEEGLEKGYDVAAVNRRGSEIQEMHIRDAAELPNFENSYTWVEDDIFISVDFRETGISPLQFISESFIEEVIHQLRIGGVKNLKMNHMYDLLISTGVIEFFYGFYRLDVNFLQNLSAMTYEHTYSEGRILIPRYDTKIMRRTKAGLKVSFQDTVPFSIDNLRQVRKLLELSDSTLALVVSESGRIIGLTDQHAHPSEADVHIYGHLYWSITYENNRNMVYRNARFHIQSSRRTIPEVRDHIHDIDPELTEAQLSKLEKIVSKVTALRHGTIILIGSPEQAKAETDRLTATKTGIEIVPINLENNFDLVKSFSMIDGAIIVDTHCYCICIGAILDGDAVAKGSRARGSRFNSTVNYIKRRSQFDQHFLGIVVSDDGSVDAVVEDKVFRLAAGT